MKNSNISKFHLPWLVLVSTSKFYLSFPQNADSVLLFDDLVIEVNEKGKNEHQSAFHKVCEAEEFIRTSKSLVITQMHRHWSDIIGKDIHLLINSKLHRISIWTFPTNWPLTLPINLYVLRNTFCSIQFWKRGCSKLVHCRLEFKSWTLYEKMFIPE
jgi:hypothetical protein